MTQLQKNKSRSTKITLHPRVWFHV